MHVDFIVEEPSAEQALNNLLPKLLGEQASYRILSLGGKPTLLRKLPDRLNAYKRWLNEQFRLVVLVDEDRSDCRKLKKMLERAALSVGLTTKTSARPGKWFHVLNRIAVEELEAWFFGDAVALRTAFPRIPVHILRTASYRDPDQIPGGTWESLERLLQKHGYYKSRMPKIEVARKVSTHMDPQR